MFGWMSFDFCYPRCYCSFTDWHEFNWRNLRWWKINPSVRTWLMSCCEKEFQTTSLNENLELFAIIFQPFCAKTTMFHFLIYFVRFVWPFGIVGWVYRKKQIKPLSDSCLLVTQIALNWCPFRFCQATWNDLKLLGLANFYIVYEFI